MGWIRMDNKTDISILLATVYDIPILVKHHRKMFEEIFKKAGWPVKTEKLVNILDDLERDFGSAFATLKFTPTDHQGPLYETGWRWSIDQEKFYPVFPWYVSNAGGTEIRVFPKSAKFPKFAF